jgi:hypothetical protein
MNVPPSRHYVVTAGKAVQHNVRIVFDDSKKIAIESDVKPSDSVIVEGQLRVDPSGAVNVLPPTSGARAGPNTATDADPDEEHRAASVPPLRIIP